MRTVAITGGFGFIGSHMVKNWLTKYPNDAVILIDSMTYAAREGFLNKLIMDRKRLSSTGVGAEYQINHVYCNISDKEEVRKVFRIFKPDHVLHFAAESHVCRSIEGPRDFIHTNIVGTFNLLEAFREIWYPAGQKQLEKHRFVHVSTDEVYGEAYNGKRFDETWSYAPRSPYAASKASSDMLVQAWHETYGMDTVITNCSNNFGPNQHPEKLIPKAIMSVHHGMPMTIYGDGKQVRDWLYVGDHTMAIDCVFNKAPSGSRYCIGGETEMTNIQVINAIAKEYTSLTGKQVNLECVFTNDRPTDDRRYAINCEKLKLLGWNPFPEMFTDNLRHTINWYITQ